MKISGLTVQYQDDSGVQHELFAGTDFTLYSKLMENSDFQNDAASFNLNVRAKYISDINDYYAVPTAHPVPTKPKMKVVSDMGTETMVDFVPPLPDVNPVVVSASSGSIKVTSNMPPVPPTPMEQTVLSALNLLINQQTKIMAALKLT